MEFEKNVRVAVGCLRSNLGALRSENDLLRTGLALTTAIAGNMSKIGKPPCHSYPHPLSKSQISPCIKLPFQEITMFFR